MEWNTCRATKPEDKDEKESIFLLFIKETPSETSMKILEWMERWKNDTMSRNKRIFELKKSMIRFSIENVDEILFGGWREDYLLKHWEREEEKEVNEWKERIMKNVKMRRRSGWRIMILFKLANRMEWDRDRWSDDEYSNDRVS